MTVNAHYLWAYAHMAQFRAAADRADFYTADGWPVAVLGRLLGVHTQRVTGRELCARLLEPELLPAIRRVAVLGTTAEVGELFALGIARAGRTLSWREHGRRESWQLDKLSNEIAGAAVDLLLICVGSPHGEALADDLRQRLPCRIVSVGAGIEMSVGRLRPSPRLLGKLGLEWAWRLLQNPTGMWRRYVLQCGPTLLRAPLDAWSTRRRL